MKRIGKLPPSLIEKPYIYRIELLDRFYKLLDNKELVFVNPDKWEDPLENLIFNARVIKDGKSFQNPAKEKIFSQCWSYEGDSYGIWKIYTTKADDKGIVKRHMGVRITTRLDRLNQLSKLNNGQYFYGVIDYKWKYELDQLVKSRQIREALRITTPDKKHLETLLLKRKCYSFENEIRLFAIPEKISASKSEKHLFRLALNPKDFISSVRFDPGMEYQEFKTHKDRLVKQYGFKPTQITQSTYFKKNRYTIDIS
ncbi:MAG: hypothetical protein KF856_05430 [Cyclobacteriaceae bacterium]|nr:hypothetical protein [Cyclobacteriaceae bacterium]